MKNFLYSQQLFLSINMNSTEFGLAMRALPLLAFVPRSNRCRKLRATDGAVVMKLKPSLTLDVASAIMDSALAYGRAENLLPLTVVILDAGGKMMASKSEDGSGIMRFDIARGKAWGALGMGISSRLIRDRLSARPTFVTSLAAVADGRFVPVPGGVLIEDADGFTIGAIGISGDTSEKDEYCAIRAVQDAGLQAEPAEIDPNWQSSSLSDHEDE